MSLDEEGFHVLVKQGENVTAGTPLVEFDKEFNEGKGLVTDCILALTNSAVFPDVRFASGMEAKQNRTVIRAF